MKLIFELGVEGRGMTLMPECDVPEYQLPEERSEALHLPHVSENELTRHYTALCKRIHGVNDGFYPLGSCTMKYNPKIDEDMAALPGFTQLHPLQSIETAQGALEALHTLGAELGEVFGMDAVTFQPAAARTVSSRAFCSSRPIIPTAAILTARRSSCPTPPTAQIPQPPRCAASRSSTSRPAQTAAWTSTRCAPPSAPTPRD